MLILAYIRYTAEQALQDTWIKDRAPKAENISLQDRIVHNLRSFRPGLVYPLPFVAFRDFYMCGACVFPRHVNSDRVWRCLDNVDDSVRAVVVVVVVVVVAVAYWTGPRTN